MSSKDDTNLRKRAGHSGGEPKESEEKPQKVYKERRKLPTVGDLLAYGDPEDEGREKTFWEVAAGPTILAVLFCISFLIFMNAPHHLSKGHQRQTFGMNEKPHLNKHVTPKVHPVPPIEKKTTEE